MAGIRRSRLDGPDRKSPADGDVVMQVLWSIKGDSMAAIRDRALIAFGMALAARRSELVALTVADVTFEAKGVRVLIRRSKTDQEGEGTTVAVPDGRRVKPVALLRDWLARSAITEGPIFRPLWKGGAVRQEALTGHAVGRIIKARFAVAGSTLRSSAATASGLDSSPLPRWQVLTCVRSSKLASTNRCRCCPVTSATPSCSTITRGMGSCRLGLVRLDQGRDLHRPISRIGVSSLLSSP